MEEKNGGLKSTCTDYTGNTRTYNGIVLGYGHAKVISFVSNIEMVL